MADLARFSVLFIIFCSSPGILREPPFFARERETFVDDMELTLYTEHYYMRMRTHHTALLAYIPCDNMVSISSSICKGICIAYLSM